MTGARGLVLALLILLVPAAAFAAPTFPPLTGRVVDNANLISPATEAELSQKLAALEAQTGRQVVVATLPDLQGYEIEEYGYQLGRAWKIGRAKEDDGALLLVAPAERKVRIEVGYGLEGVLTDALSSVIIQSRILPAFREGRFEVGIVAGADAVVQQLSLPDDQARANVAQTQAQAARSGGGGTVPLIFVALILFWILGGILRGFGGRGRRGRGGAALWLLPLILSGGGRRHDGWGGGGFGGGGFSGGGGSFGGGGFSGGGGSFGGGGSSGNW